MHLPTSPLNNPHKRGWFSPWREGQCPSGPIPGMSTSLNCSGQAPRDFCFQEWKVRGSTSRVVAPHGCPCPASDLWPTILLDALGGSTQAFHKAYGCGSRGYKIYRLAWLSSQLSQANLYIFLTCLTFGSWLTLLREQVEWSRMLPSRQQATWRTIVFMCLQGWLAQDPVGRIMIGDSD